jgi:hypothetical protein
MAYIGNQPLTAAFLTDTFSGNGSTVAFTMTVAPANSSSIIVAVTGVLQDPSTYSVSGTTLTFSAAPPTGTNNISVRYLGLPASGVVTTAYRTVTEFTATASQTTFSVPSYTVGYVDVYRNGVMLGSADYTATSGTTIVLASGATAGDLVEVISFYVSSVLNAIPGTAGSVGNTFLANAAVTPAKLSTGAPSWDSSGNLSFNSGYGSTAVAYGCRAWVNFNGTGTVAIRASGNVTSITDNGTGDYTVNFTTAMPDANYVTVGSVDRVAGGGEGILGLYAVNGSGALVPPTTTAARVTTSTFNNSDVDLTYVCVSVFR